MRIFLVLESIKESEYRRPVLYQQLTRANRNKKVTFYLEDSWRGQETSFNALFRSKDYSLSVGY